MAGTIMLTAEATGAGSGFSMPDNGNTSFQVSGSTTSGAGAAIVDVEVSNDGDNWDNLGTITLTLGTASTSDSFSTLGAHWELVRMNVTAISGTGASVRGFGKDLVGV
jgi:hypothetical protein